MNDQKCPLCGQSLPHAIDGEDLQRRIQKLSSTALTKERAKLQQQYKVELRAELVKSQREAERDFERQLKDAERRARSEASNEMKQKLAAAEERNRASEVRQKQEIARIRKEEQSRVRREMEERAELKGLQAEAKMEKLSNERERDKRRYEEEVSRYKSKIDDLQRRMEKQTGEQLGEEAERDLSVLLQSAFPTDKIERISRGVRGADILHYVRENGANVGTVVYESKNTLDWNKSFVAQAKKYRSLYDTRYVLIVTRKFPKKQRGLCIVEGIPVIEPKMALDLAKVIREGIIEISKLKLSGTSQDKKSLELYEYIRSDKFCMRFKDIQEGIDQLRAQQASERRSHEIAWENQSRLHDRIAGKHREVDAQIRAICGGSSRVDGRIAPASEPYRNTPFIAARLSSPDGA